MPSEPFCGNCGYSLVGATESSKCPDCGRPLVEVLQRTQVRVRGRRYRSSVVLFGLPLIDIALGPHEEEPIGKARGIIAIGDQARGWLALGGLARGIVALGGTAIGLVAVGGFAMGVFALGGGAIGLLFALGGGAAGTGISIGGGAVGFIAEGGGAVGYYAAGGGVWGQYVMGPMRRDQQAVDVFALLHSRVGLDPRNGPLGMLIGMGSFAALLVIAPTAILGLIVMFAYLRWKRRALPPAG